MPIYGAPGEETNSGLYSSDEYSYELIMAFFNDLNRVLSPQGRNGGDTDPMHSAATMGRNSLDIRFIPKFCAVPAVTALFAELENEAGDQVEIERPFPAGDLDTVAARTAAWLAEFHAAVTTQLAALRMPIRLAVIRPTVHTIAPAGLVPSEWVAA